MGQRNVGLTWHNPTINGRFRAQAVHEASKSYYSGGFFCGGLLFGFQNSFQKAKAAPPPSKTSETFLALFFTRAVSEATAGRTQRLSGK